MVMYYTTVANRIETHRNLIYKEELLISVRSGVPCLVNTEEEVLFAMFVLKSEGDFRPPPGNQT